jgi:hypothetical protein
MRKGMIIWIIIAVCVIICFSFTSVIGIELDDDNQIDSDESSGKDLYQIFGFLPYLGRGIMYRYWVFPGILGFVEYNSFEGDVGILTIRGHSTEPPTYFSIFLPEPVMNLILKALNLI